MTVSPGLLHMEHPLRAFYQFFLDLIVFTIKSIFYILESIYYSLLPQRFRKLKVQCEYFNLNVKDFLSLIDPAPH